MSTSLKTICAWCDILIKDGELLLFEGKKYPSHGICKECRIKVEANTPILKENNTSDETSSSKKRLISKTLY